MDPFLECGMKLDLSGKLLLLGLEYPASGQQLHGLIIGTTSEFRNAPSQNGILSTTIRSSKGFP